jgi:hypothetical protein
VLAERRKDYKLIGVKIIRAGLDRNPLRRVGPNWDFGHGNLFLLGLSVLLCALPVLARPQQAAPVPGTETGVRDAPGTAGSAAEQQAGQRTIGNVTGTVVDQSGAVVAGARVTLATGDANLQMLSGDDGQFTFNDVAAGPFQITVTLAGFAPQKYSGTLMTGDFFFVPSIALTVATEETEVRVGLPPTELAEAQIKEQEKQRVFGVIPNFYVTYIPNAAPLAPRQKFELAWKTLGDPVTFVIVGATAGLEQAQNQFKGYGQGAQGYGKRYAANYADSVTSTLLGGAVFPSLFKQDPRYFYKGTGSTRSRILYALANSVICKGDNGRWQFNYSALLGGLMSGAISNAYYPPDARGAGLLFEGEGIGIGTSAASNLVQEFLIPKLTPNLPHRQASQP